jgi:hypothetical protein
VRFEQVEYCPKRKFRPRHEIGRKPGNPLSHTSQTQGPFLWMKPRICRRVPQLTYTARNTNTKTRFRWSCSGQRIDENFMPRTSTKLSDEFAQRIRQVKGTLSRRPGLIRPLSKPLQRMPQLKMALASAVWFRISARPLW